MTITTPRGIINTGDKIEVRIKHGYQSDDSITTITHSTWEPGVVEQIIFPSHIFARLPCGDFRTLSINDADGWRIPS